jgi:raffinose/stachyose/melibiose transport system permease protein
MSIKRNGRSVAAIAGRLILAVVLVAYLVPILWMYSSSMRSNGEILLDPLGLPKRIDFTNYVTAWEMANLGRHFIISITITAISMVLVVSFSTLAAYGFSRLDFAGRKALYAFFLLGLILPVQSFLVGLFILFRELGLLNNIWSVILPVSAVGLPLSILLAKNYFDSLPSSLEESAVLEGAGTFLIYRRIILPLSVPIIATIITFTVIGVWNEFMIPFVMIQNAANRPLTTSLYVFSTKYSQDYALKLTALTMIATPMFVIYYAFQSQIQKGITAGAIKS